MVIIYTQRPAHQLLSRRVARDEHESAPISRAIAARLMGVLGCSYWVGTRCKVGPQLSMA